MGRNLQINLLQNEVGELIDSKAALERNYGDHVDGVRHKMLDEFEKFQKNSQDKVLEGEQQLLKQIDNLRKRVNEGNEESKMKEKMVREIAEVSEMYKSKTHLQKEKLQQ